MGSTFAFKKDFLVTRIQVVLIFSTLVGKNISAEKKTRILAVVKSHTHLNHVFELEWVLFTQRHETSTRFLDY